MDPIIELATVAVSYLWLWRELFPETQLVAAGAALSATEITVHRAMDMAMYARMRDLTLRPADAQVAAPGDSGLASLVTEAPDIAELVRRVALQRVADAGARATKVPAKVKWYDTKATRADLVVAQMLIAEKYVEDLQAIVGVLGTVDLNGGMSDADSGTGSGRNTAGPMS